MKHISRLLLAAMLICAALIVGRPSTARADPAILFTNGSVTCNSVTVSGFVSGDFLIGVVRQRFDPIGPIIQVSGTPPADTFTVTIPFTATPGETVYLADNGGDMLPFIVPKCAGFQGPGIPAGFVLLTVTCNTPVFTTAGGNTPSGADTVKAGQTFFANPKPVIDAKGKSWTEIFVSSYNDPFIPTSCLGGAPAH